MIEITIKNELLEIRHLLSEMKENRNKPCSLCKLLEAKGLLGPLIRLGLWNKEFLEVTSYWQFSEILRESEILRNLPVKNSYPNIWFKSDIYRRYLLSR